MADFLDQVQSPTPAPDLCSCAGTVFISWLLISPREQTLARQELVHTQIFQVTPMKENCKTPESCMVLVTHSSLGTKLAHEGSA